MIHVADSEEALLGAMVSNPSIVLDVTDHVCAEDFANGSYRDMYRIAIRLWQDGGLTVERLAKAIAEVGGMASAAADLPVVSANWEFDARRIKEASTKRKLLALAEKVRDDIKQAAVHAVDDDSRRSRPSRGRARAIRARPDCMRRATRPGSTRVRRGRRGPAARDPSWRSSRNRGPTWGAPSKRTSSDRPPTPAVRGRAVRPQ